MTAIRRIVRWGCLALLPGEVVLFVCLLGGVPLPGVVRVVVEAAVAVVLSAAVGLLVSDYRRHRAGLPPRAAFLAALGDTLPPSVVKLTVHEVTLSTSFLRWVSRRGAHGVGEGDTAVAYASGQTVVVFGFLFVSVVETVALFFLIPWPAVHLVVTVLDVWGVYFIVALHASCVVRPHVLGADGSLRLRYGALLDIRVPAGLIASARVERAYPEGRLGRVGENGVADLAVASQTTVTVELTEPLAFVRALGGRAQARGFRFYAERPAAVVAALSKRTGETPGSAAVSRTSTR
ncbi:hypothetical protein ACFQLX_18120 [Streptomyces polyrhachis]|uniref:Integral membrane protein n=1 Tax=Streptomyces polyrhachis TaxID=1282885 RepID=A0ABW2GKP8_9ACTN